MTYETQETAGSPAVHYTSLFEALPGSCILLAANAPRYTILAATPEYLMMTGTTKESLIGKSIFEAFPTNFADPADTGTNDVRASLDLVRLQKTPHHLPAQRYDVKGEKGVFLKRYWKVVNKPVFSPEGELVYILHAAEDITAEVKALKLQAHIKEIEESEQRFRLMADAIPEIDLTNSCSISFVIRSLSSG